MQVLSMNSKLNRRLRRWLLLILGATPLGWAQAQTELIVNGGFELDSAGWVLSGSPYVATPTTDSTVARSGTNFLWFGGVEYETDAAYQTITVPANEVSCTLSFYYNIISEEGNPAAYDLFSATIRDNNGALLATIGNWSNIVRISMQGILTTTRRSSTCCPTKARLSAFVSPASTIPPTSPASLWTT